MHRPTQEESSVARYDDEVRVREEFLRARDKRAKTEVFDDRSAEEKRPAVEPATVMPMPESERSKPRKRPNYLQHSDRCHIIRRVDRGEKQAKLAREFGVTRAAVCQMYKKRDEILSRGEFDEGDTEHEIAEHELGAPLRAATQSHDAGLSTEMLEINSKNRAQPVAVRSKTVPLLLKVLQDPRSSSAAFERAARRLSFILIEEVFANYDGQVAGHTKDRAFCGVSLGAESASFETALCQIDTKAQTGQIHVKPEQVGWKLQYLDVPDNIAGVEVLLFSTSGSGGAECKAIEALRSIGVRDERISLVMVVCTSRGYEEISTRYPSVKIITAVIDDRLRLPGFVRG